jgi:FlaA1/EpsC-like NDP-sugar epimerase
MTSNSVRLLLQVRRLLIAALHVGLIALAWIGSFALRFDFSIQEPFRGAMLSTLPLVIGIKLVVFWLFGLFHGWWKYVGLSDLITILKAAIAGGVLAGIAHTFVFGLEGFPRSVFLMDIVLTFLFVGGIRFIVRAYSESFRSSAVKVLTKRVLVVGAGRTGTTLVREMRTNHSLHYEPVAFVDDDPQKQGLKVHGVPVRGTTADISALVDQLAVDEVLLAIPGSSGRALLRIIESSRESPIVFKTIPGVADLIDGRISVSRIREVQIDDLLGREPIETDLMRVRSNSEGHIVMVTGAAGSIGSELCRQIATMTPGHLVLFERSESDLHDLELSLRQTLPNAQVTAVVGDILDLPDVTEAFERFRPSRVYHAAAYKHVTLMENHVVAAARHNVIGTYNVALVAQRYRAEQFVLISTDKAVRPTSLMGATKRAAERVLLSMADGGTRFTVVRFGNVLGSRGSVVPIFKRQIAAGGPVTVTHPDVVRYFMTIPEAAQLVLHAAAMGRGGDIFHLDMGEPVKIADLAANMIRLSGFEPGRDIEMQFVGLRPGEKLYEELLMEGDEVLPTAHPRIRLVRAADPGLSEGWLEALTGAIEARDTAAIVSAVRAAVPDYVSSDIVLRPVAPQVKKTDQRQPRY